MKDYRGKSLPNKVEGILFDFDGTLIDLIPKWWEPIERAFITVHGSVPEKELRENISGIMGSLPKERMGKFFILRIMYSIGRGAGLGKLQTMRFMKESRIEFQKSRFINIPFDGIENMLAQLTKNGIKIGIVSSASTSELKRAIVDLDFLKDIPYISRNDVEAIKPSAEPILKGLKLIGTPAEKTLYVGDFHSDVRAGKAANTMTCAILGAVPELSKKGLEREEPDLILEKTVDLLDYIIS